MMTNSKPEQDVIIDITNEFALHTGQNLPNHTSSLEGRGKFVRVGYPAPVIFRSKQEVYRFCAYALSMAETLPDETVGPVAHSFEQIQEAVNDSNK
jgi:hypothetical protein